MPTPTFLLPQWAKYLVTYFKEVEGGALGKVEGVNVVMKLLCLILLPLVTTRQSALRYPMERSSSLVGALFGSSVFGNGARSDLVHTHRRHAFFRHLNGAFATFFERFSGVSRECVRPRRFGCAIVLRGAGACRRCALCNGRKRQVSFTPSPS